MMVGLMLLSVGPGSGTLQEDVASAPYHTESYVLNSFDCTDMSAIMCTHLRSHGYDARLSVWLTGKITGHAMVTIHNHSDHSCIFVESTRKQLTAFPLKGLRFEGEYRDIIDASENSRWGASEWGLDLYLKEKTKEG